MQTRYMRPKCISQKAVAHLSINHGTARHSSTNQFEDFLVYTKHGNNTIHENENVVVHSYLQI